MLKSNPSYLGIAGKNPALGPPKSALGLRPWADFGGPRAGFFPEFLGQGLDFLPESTRIYHFGSLVSCLSLLSKARCSAYRVRANGV